MLHPANQDMAPARPNKANAQFTIRLILDVLAPAACVFGMGLALSDLLSGNNFGTPTTLPWAINLWGALRHPVQMYEFIALGVVLMALVWVDRRNWPTALIAQTSSPLRHRNLDWMTFAEHFQKPISR